MIVADELCDICLALNTNKLTVAGDMDRCIKQFVFPIFKFPCFQERRIFHEKYMENLESARLF